jgi:invasion protein IalB
VVVKLALTGAAACLLLTAAPALAQAPSGPDALPSKPDIKTVGDWQVRCINAHSPNPCDQFWEQVDPRSGQKVIAISIAYLPSSDRHLMQVSVPLGVSIPRGVTIQTDSYTSPALRYRMCSRDGCFVQTAVDNGLIESLAKSGPDAKVNIADESGRVFNLPLSLKGFSGAHDEMVSEAKSRSKAPTAAAKP